MKILPDGSVEIRNKKTGATKIVQPTDLPSYGIPYSNFEKELEAYKSISGEGRKNTKATAELRKEFSTETKNLGFKEIQSSWNKVREADETGAGDLTIVYSYIKALDPTTAVREGEINLTKAAESIPDNIIRAYKRAKEGKVISPNLRREMISEVAGIYNEKAKKQKELNSFYSGLASDSDLDPEDVIGGVGSVELAQEPTIKTGTVGGIKNIPILGPILSQLQGVAQDVGVGLGQRVGGEKLQQSQNLAFEMARKVQQKALQTQDLEEQQRLFQVAQQVIETMGRGARETESAFSQDIEKPYLGRGFSTASNVTSLATLPSIGRSLPGFIKSIPGTVKSAGGLIPPRGAVTEAASRAGTLNTKAVVQAGEQYARDNPLARELWDKINPSIPRKMSASNLLGKMFDVWKGAYTKTGDVRAKAESQLYNKLYGAGRRVIEEQAPAVSKEISKLKFLHEIPKKVQQSTWITLKGTAIGKLLGLY